MHSRNYYFLIKNAAVTLVLALVHDLPIAYATPQLSNGRPDVHAPLTKQQRIVRNYELAKKFYDGYANMPKVGYPDAFKAEDWEPGAEIHSFAPEAGPEGYLDPKRRWLRITKIDKPQDWKDYDREEYSGILKVLPDWHIVTPHKAFCDENGCAWQMNVGGHDSDGAYYEINEIEFMWTNKFGRIIKTEVFIDWVNMPDFIQRIHKSTAGAALK